MGKADRVKFSTKKRSKRKFKGNQYTKARDQQQHDDSVDYDKTPTATASSSNNQQQWFSETSSQTPLHCLEYLKTFENIETNTPKASDAKIDGYRIIDLELLTQFISSLCCPNCYANGLLIRENFLKKHGFSSMLYLQCECGFKKEFYTSQNAGKKAFDINRRIIYTMRNLGQGYSGLQKFTTFMNMPTPMTVRNFSRSVKIIAKTVEKVAEKSMSEAAAQITTDSEGVTDTAVSCDGTWQRRGFSSLNGCYTAMSLNTGHILTWEGRVP